MFRKYVLISMVGLTLIGTNAHTLFAAQTVDKDLEKVKSDVRRTGTGPDAKVVVKLKNGIKIKGFISLILPDSFDVTNQKTKQVSTIPYRDVAKVKKQGLSTGLKIALGAAIGAGVVIAIVAGGLSNSGLGSICPLGCSTMLRP